jgi:RimJ/RimL family protein N-acetyltransferase
MLVFLSLAELIRSGKALGMNGDGGDVLTMPQILATERLILRQFRRDDAPDVNSFADDPDYRRYLGEDHPSATDFLANNVDADWHRAPSWAIELDGRVVGGVFLGVDAANRRAELACLISPAHWREGIALEACRAVVDSAFAIGLHQVWARADAENVGSIAAMKRLGMRRDDRRTTGTDVEQAEKNEVRYVLDRS